MSEPTSASEVKEVTSKRDLIEGSEHSEGELANWFHTSTWPVLLAKIPGKGAFYIPHNLQKKKINK